MGVNRRRAGTVLIDRPREGARLAALALLVATLFGFISIAQPQPAWAVSGEAQQLLNLINQERAAVGAQSLSFRDDLVQIAAEHSAWMASTGTFQHRSDLSEGVTGPWTRIGENIAYGWSVPNIHQMFMASQGHCENNLYAGFNRVGIEFATGGTGAMYVTVVFVQESGGSLPKPTVCPYDYSTTTTAPPATTTTTAPPATTTTAPPATTTTAPPATTTTTAPPSTTTTTAATGEVILPIGSTTTTLSVAPTQESVEGSEGSDSAGSALESPISAAGPSADDGNTQSGFPVAAVAGVVTALVAAGAWWLIGIKRGAMAAVARPSWEIPHGGVRPPQ